MSLNPFVMFRKNIKENKSIPQTNRLESSGSHADSVFNRMQESAINLTKTEPYMTNLLKQSILHPKTNSFKVAIARAIASRLISSCGKNPFMCTDQTTEIIEAAFESTDLEYGCTMIDAVVKDIIACYRRDPACQTELEVVLFYKGFAALVCHRAARRHYQIDTTDGGTTSRRFVSLWLQSQASAAFGVDIHPAGEQIILFGDVCMILWKINCSNLSILNFFSISAEIGAGVFFDHATGLVIGETAKVGNNCTILHGVTLGGTGKDAFDRHPKIGDNVMIGAGAKVLGNIKIGNGAKIGAGSIVLKPIPSGATAVGAPAKIIGWALEKKPGSFLDASLSNLVQVGSTKRMLDTSSSSESLSTHKHDNDGDIEDSINDSLAADDSNTESNEETKTACSFNDMCIFRMLSKNNEQGSLTFKQFNNVLGENCTEDEIGEVYMGLLKKNRGKSRVTTKEVKSHFCSIAQKYTKMDKQQLTEAEACLSK